MDAPLLESKDDVEGSPEHAKPEFERFAVGFTNSDVECADDGYSTENEEKSKKKKKAHNQGRVRHDLLAAAATRPVSLAV